MPRPEPRGKAMRRREFITLLGGAAMVGPMATHAQQPGKPVIGYLDSRSLETVVDRVRGLRQGLKEAGYVEGENVTIEYRWAEDRMDRLQLLAADFVSRSVAAIVTAGPTSSFAAKAATTTIPIVFMTGNDPVELGLSASFSRPSGNLTGISFFTAQLGAKRLELLRDLLPQVSRIGVLVNPADQTLTDIQLKEVTTAARVIGIQIKIYNADTRAEIDAAFEAMGSERPDAVFVATTPFLNGRRVQLAQL